MRILIPTADYPPIEGGISTVTVHVARELAALGHAVTVIAPWFPGQGAFDAGEPVRVIRFRGYRLGWLRFAPMLAATWPHMRTSELIVGINVAYGGVFGWMAHARYGTPYIVPAYAYEFLKFRAVPPLRALLRAVYRRAAGVVAISEFTRENLVEFGIERERIALAHPGADPVAAPAAARIQDVRERLALDDGPIILAVGRFIARKGHGSLVEAMPRVLEGVPRAQLVLVGQGPCMAEVAWAATRLGVRHRVTIPGVLSDDEVAALYAMCDVFALPVGADKRGQVEGFGLVFAEAHAYGKPVVAGRSGGVVDAVIDGETGLIVEPGQPEALAAALLRLLRDRALAHRLGENGQQRVRDELNWSAFTRRMMEAAGL